jgi:hypothetical protein
MPAIRTMPILIALLLLLIAPPAAAQRWTAVDVGMSHTCALDSGGRAFCWGINHDGQLGARTPRTCAPSHHGAGERCWASASEQPVRVAGDLSFRTLSVGGSVSCALDGEGRAWCWGRNAGDGEEGCNLGVCSFVPVPFQPERRFAMLRVGEDAVCAITTEGAGHCWRPVRGGRGRWMMADVAPGERLAWVEQYGDWMSPDEQITCAVAVDGRAFCQGLNDFAQLGAGDTIPRAGAVRVGTDARFVRVHPWSGSTCGLAAEGRAICWGVAASRPSWPDGSPPRPWMFACRYSGWCSGPRAYAPEVRFAALTVVRDRFCGLDVSGQVHCWDLRDRVRVAQGVRLTTLEGSETHACGLARDGAIWCWRQDSGAPATPPVRAPDPPR